MSAEPTTTTAAAAEGSPDDKQHDSQDQTPNGSKVKRTSRACLACRSRKSRCDLDSAQGQPNPPCSRCVKEKKECIIGSSNRGGRRVRKSTLSQNEPSSPNASTVNAEPANPNIPTWSIDNAPSLLTQASSIPARDANAPPTFSAQPSSGAMEMTMQIDPVLNSSSNTHLSAPQTAISNLNGSRSSSGDDNLGFSDLQNPSDALDILAHIASNGERQSHWPSKRPKLDHNSSTDLNYHLVQTGALSTSRVSELVARYRDCYHSFYPLVPPHVLDLKNLSKTASEEPHLLTAILVISTRCLVDEPRLFARCAEHMKNLVSALAAGGPGGVEAVEALLLLAEWTPYTSITSSGQVGRGEEDREAWMHVGTALRIGYFLGLDRYSFRFVDRSKDPQAQRKRLVWTACYISDRQISIRIGRGFWSRGPGPMTTLRKEDFPSLQPKSPGDEDYATIFQATLELTMLFSNVHDVLYSNPTGFRSHLSGGYIKFIDDFRSAIYGWNSVYGTLTCSQNIKATLLMSYDYLRLYTNAFAFHATIQRAMPKAADGKTPLNRIIFGSHHGGYNVGSVGDARFIYEGLDAAKSLLATMNNFVDAERCLRYLPLRFYLYTIYAGVFLYRARTVGIMSPEEDQSVRRMIQQTVGKLEQASVSDQHPGSRYSRLLSLLWDKVDRKSRKDHRGASTMDNPYRPGASNSAQTPTASGMPMHTPGATSQHSVDTNESVAVTEQMGDFSWTDLDAIGNFALNGNDGLGGGENANGMTDWWSGFLPADNNTFGGVIGLDSTDDWMLNL